MLNRFNSIPQNIEARIMEFMVTTWQQTKGIDTNAVVNLCPKDLKADICVHLHRFLDHFCWVFFVSISTGACSTETDALWRPVTHVCDR